MSCGKILCDNKIYTKNLHLKALLAIKHAKGYGFEDDEEYKQLTNCLSEIEIYQTEEECSNNNGKSFENINVDSKTTRDVHNFVDKLNKRKKEKDELLQKINPKLFKKKMAFDKKFEKYHDESKAKFAFDQEYTERHKSLRKEVVQKKKEKDKDAVYESEKAVRQNIREHELKRKEAYLEEYNKLDLEEKMLNKEIKEVLDNYTPKNGGTRKRKRKGKRTRRYKR